MWTRTRWRCCRTGVSIGKPGQLCLCARNSWNLCKLRQHYSGHTPEITHLSSCMCEVDQSNHNHGVSVYPAAATAALKPPHYTGCIYLYRCQHEYKTVLSFTVLWCRTTPFQLTLLLCCCLVWRLAPSTGCRRSLSVGSCSLSPSVRRHAQVRSYESFLSVRKNIFNTFCQWIDSRGLSFPTSCDINEEMIANIRWRAG